MKYKVSRFLLLAIIVGFMSSCDNGSNYYVPPHYPEAKINIENGSRNKYFVEINGPEQVTITLEGKTFQEVKLKPGEYSIKSTQLDGYIFLPTKNRFSVILADGDHKALEVD